jgi:3'(2'), 5'-bisphosphate nucleotidase
MRQPISDHQKTAIAAAIDGGIAIMEVYTEGNPIVWKKADQSPLTKADLNSHHRICRMLEASGLPVLSEESDSHQYELRKNWSQFWLIDPLDGTKEFVKRNGEFSVNIALIDNHISVQGVILEPVAGRLYFGNITDGSFVADLPPDWLNADIDLTIERLKPQPLNKHCIRTIPSIAASRSHLDHQTAHIISTIHKKYGKVDMVTAGSALKLCRIAEGNAHIYPRLGPTMEWDIAAGHAIIKGMGGNVFRLDNQSELSYNRSDLVNPYFIAIDGSPFSNELIRFVFQMMQAH